MPPTGTESKWIKERIEKVRIAVTAQDKELSSGIDLRFGRAKWLIVIDTETNDFQAYDNIVNLNAPQGAGIQTGQNIANLEVEAVITGNIGPNAFKTLRAAGIKIFLAEQQMVQKAIDLIKETGKASASHLQRGLRVGYPRAARLVDELEDMGVLGPSQGGGRDRDILIDLNGGNDESV